MNKSAIQKYAIWARVEMIAQVEQRAYQYGITKDGYGEENAVTVQGRALSNQEQEQRWELIQQIKRKGYAQVMEEVAYTWFNRFIALRFMEVNNYLPTHIRVFSDSTGAYKPEILSVAMQMELEGLDRNKVAQMIDANHTEDLYRYLLLTQCNALNEALPRMFEKMGGYTELLLPNNILRADGILGRMVNEIPEEDWTDQVQIIGWLYQYYNAELKDETFALLKKNVKITKERIPSATQLFTPDWIVRYMVENSLGRLWVEGHPNDALKANWKYYLEEAEQEPRVYEQLKKIRAEYSTLTPQDIKVIDPCMGSGHILVYAFDVLVQIYKASGYSERDAAKLILENNLYGLDIDDRAAQLAYFAVMMKARQYDRRIFARGVQPNVFAIQESNNINRRHLKFFGWQMSDLERNLAMNQLNVVLDEFNDAKEYGSILNITKQDWKLLKRFVQSVDYSGQMTLEAMGLEDTRDHLLELVKIATVMAQKYDVVVTNPPYMGSGGMTQRLADYVKDYYQNGKADMFAVFIERCSQMTRRNGFQAMITQQVFMFIPTFEKLRFEMYNRTISSLLQIGFNSFPEMNSKVALAASFVIQNANIKNYIGSFADLTRKAPRSADKQKVFEEVIRSKTQYHAKKETFMKIPGAPMAYWVGNNLIEAFEGSTVKQYGFAGIGMRTGDNQRFLRLWHEVSRDNLLLGCKNKHEQIISQTRWIPYNKGGDFRKWYGNNSYVVNWYNDGEEIKDNTRQNYPYLGDDLGWKISNEKYYYLPGITWSGVSMATFSCRCYEEGFIFDSGANGLFAYNEEDRYYLLGILNSCVGNEVIKILNPTINTGSGTVNQVPVIISQKHREEIVNLVKECINITKADWDSFEGSWEFARHPLVGQLTTIEAAFEKWKLLCEWRYNRLKLLEENLNKLFINIYGLENELSPEISEDEVSVRTANLVRDIKGLISYAVGCMFGRYSMNLEGLTYAGGEWDASKYKTIVPVADNIIPICDDDYFDEDITSRFIRWVEIVYGKDTLEENLKFIAHALGGKRQPRDVIRDYFQNEFFVDHCGMYSVTGSGKRPIYWLFDSGKKNGFKALVYMHRYQSDLLARMRTDYVHEMQERYRTQLMHLNDAIAQASTSERMKLNKQLKKIQDQALELQKYEEKIHHLADQNIKIDLDDGVKHNYALFGDVLAKIK